MPPPGYTAGKHAATFIEDVPLDADELRVAIAASLIDQGFLPDLGSVGAPHVADKAAIRRLHEPAVTHKLDQRKPSLARHETRLLRHIANGCEVSPERIEPHLQVVTSDSEDELLFRYVTLHWSIPVSPGYGRRIRCLIIDGQNDKLIGIIGLGDPVFSLGSRDNWIGWDKTRRCDALHHVMDIFALGAVPPYSYLLAGKLAALIASSREVIALIREKYGGRPTFIRERTNDGTVALLTTTSALGRSSIYNRLTFCGEPAYISVGYTRGSGEVQFSNSLFNHMAAYARANCTPTAKHKQWGTGFRNRREVIKKCLASLELPHGWIYHGIRREVFVIPLARNAKEFLLGAEAELAYYDRSVGDLFSWFRQRWLLPRAAWDTAYRTFDRHQYGLWER